MIHVLYLCSFLLFLYFVFRWYKNSNNKEKHSKKKLMMHFFFHCFFFFWLSPHCPSFFPSPLFFPVRFPHLWQHKRKERHLVSFILSLLLFFFFFVVVLRHMQNNDPDAIASPLHRCIPLVGTASTCATRQRHQSRFQTSESSCLFQLFSSLLSRDGCSCVHHAGTHA